MTIDTALLAKTQAGQLEIRVRRQPLSRIARTLLLLADGKRSAAQLLQMVQGATLADLQSLCDAGLLAAAGAATVVAPTPAATIATDLDVVLDSRLEFASQASRQGPASTAVVDSTATATARTSAPVAMAAPVSVPLSAFAAPPEPLASVLSYRELHDSLQALVKEQFGLLKGIKFAADIDNADGLPELEAVARRFTEEVRRRKGDADALRARRLLGLLR